jgi:O-antigen chain-terminating methyltransferase
VPGGILLVETPNPLSPFALGEFHTDPTHVTPIPPERLRFELEAAGFEAPRLLFQGPIPPGFRFGPDPRSYYLDYAAIAYRSAK